MKKLFIFFTLAILATASLTHIRHDQRGGGSSSFSSFSSGGSSFFGGSSFYGGYGYGYGGSGGNPLSGVAIGSILGGGCLCVICMVACQKYCKPEKAKQLRLTYHDQIDRTSMPIQVYKSYRDRALKLLNESEDVYNFAFMQGTQKSQMRAHASIVKEEDFCTEIQALGSDKYGTWKADGDILCRNGQLFMWLVKDYDNKQAAGQTGAFIYLIYQSLNFTPENGFDGKWFYDGFEESSQYSGQWKLWDAMGPNNVGGNINNGSYNRSYLMVPRGSGNYNGNYYGGNQTIAGNYHNEGYPGYPVVSKRSLASGSVSYPKLKRFPQP